MARVPGMQPERGMPSQRRGAASAVPHPNVKKLFFLSMALDDDHAEIENEWIAALAGATRVLDGVLLCTLSHLERENAHTHERVSRVIDVCAKAKPPLEVYWGRRLWVTWHAETRQKFEDYRDPAYYRECLESINVEAGELVNRFGDEVVAGTCLDTEPYGHSIYAVSDEQHPFFKRTGFTPSERCEVLGAIGEALKMAPRASMALPAGGQYPTHFAWTLRELGEEYLHEKTYKVVTPDKLNVCPPYECPPPTPDKPGEQEPVMLNWWGTWLTDDVNVDPQTLGRRAMTVDEWADLDFAAVARAFRKDFCGNWLYSMSSERANVLRALGGAGANPRRLTPRSPMGGRPTPGCSPQE